MKNQLLSFVITFAIINIAIGQNVQYQVCNSCLSTDANDPDTVLFNYDPAISFDPRDIEGDYDRRWWPGAPQGSRWHTGLDMSSRDDGGGDADRGDAILAIEGGVITILDGVGYKMLVIEGDDGHHFGYGHLFRKENPGNTHIKSGNFVLKKLYNESERYSIINLATCVAISENSGDTVIFQNNFCQRDTFITVNRVTAGQAIAPIGDSGGSNSNYISHLHLDRYRNPHLPGYMIKSKTNCMDPWTCINHPALPTLNAYDLEFHTEDEPYNQIVIDYPTNTTQTMRLRAKMHNAAAPTYNNSEATDDSRYENTVMAINESKILLKSASRDSFRVALGPYYESRINLSGRDSLNATFYPSLVGLCYFFPH